jgi:hypothetical protein
MTEKTWNILFPNEKMKQPYVGAVADYAGCLGKYLPDDVEIDSVHEVNQTHEK